VRAPVCPRESSALRRRSPTQHWVRLAAPIQYGRQTGKADRLPVRGLGWDVGEPLAQRRLPERDSRPAYGAVNENLQPRMDSKPEGEQIELSLRAEKKVEPELTQLKLG
jgi:hypothetical protein